MALTSTTPSPEPIEVIEREFFGMACELAFVDREALLFNDNNDLVGVISTDVPKDCEAADGTLIFKSTGNLFSDAEHALGVYHEEQNYSAWESYLEGCR